MTDAKGPYLSSDIFITKHEHHFQLNSDTADLANAAYAAGRASRDGLREALMKLRDCDWSIGIGDRMDPVRDIAKEALEADGDGKP